MAPMNTNAAHMASTFSLLEAISILILPAQKSATAYPIGTG